MLDGEALRDVVVAENPDFVVPVVDELHAPTLVELEARGYTVVPSEGAVRFTWTREGIRRLAAEQLGLRTSAYAFADTEAEFADAVRAVGYPCVAKPVMSSTGLGVTTLDSAADLANAWSYTQSGGRAAAGRVIVEAKVPFDFEVVLLTARHGGDTTFCEPIGYRQLDGEFLEAWQPQPMTPNVLAKAQAMAEKVTEALEGVGVFAVEFFVEGEEVIFNTVCLRPHEAGLVTLVSQDVSQFALQVRATLGLPVPAATQQGPAALCVLRSASEQSNVTYSGLDRALAEPGTSVHLFGPNAMPTRRVGAVLTRAEGLAEARERARRAADAVTIRPG